jgi:hypothetical protein
MSKKKLMESTGKEETFEPTNLDQIMGYNQLSRYNTAEASSYEESLKEMNRTDLEEEARRVGVVILEDTQRLRLSLAKEFTVFFDAIRKPRHISKPIKISKDVEKILKEGR